MSERGEVEWEFIALAGAVAIIFTSGIIGASCVGMERARTERVHAERNCPTPTEER